MDVKFAISSYLPENLANIEKQMKESKWEKETTVEQLQQEEAILTQLKYTFQVKKQEFVRFMAQSSPFAMQVLHQIQDPQSIEFLYEFS